MSNKLIADINNEDSSVFFRTLYSIHYPFTIDQIKLFYNQLILGGNFNSCFEVEDVFVRDCHTKPGLYFNNNILWDDELKHFLEENSNPLFLSAEKFPLSQKRELEYYFEYNKNRVSSYNSALGTYDLIEPYIGEDGNTDSEAYENDKRKLENEYNKKHSSAILKDAIFTDSFFRFNHNDYDLDFFYETFLKGDDFEIVKFIFDSSFYISIIDFLKFIDRKLGKHFFSYTNFIEFFIDFKYIL